MQDVDFLFSIAIHDDFESALDLIENTNHFVPNCFIIVHLSHSFQRKQDFIQLIKSQYRNVIVNEISLRTGLSDQTLFFVHYSNLLLIEREGIKYKYFSIVGSNQLFVKELNYQKVTGLMKKAEYEVKTIKNDNQLFNLQYCKPIKRLFHKLNIKTIHKIPPEGVLYPRELMGILFTKPVVDYYNKFLSFYLCKRKSELRTLYNNIAKRIVTRRLSFLNGIIPSCFPMFRIASEEVIFPSLIFKDYPLSKMPYSNYCFLNWKNNLSVTLEDINVIQVDGSELYAVKRVDRKIDDPIRTYIRSL
ncbi:hypothetical protein L2D36_09995 [Vibrio harveyi]|uniref:hypothetical protein n=1 Tax=Vibrio TaxID=662 RepID=UPI0022CD37BB|nr:hypothetical protein [Vibrio sp. NFR]MDA0132316.1 hypothetical protein [Vibrio sp. NFR]